ncbi:hypothetical protein HMPREF0208_02806 [Citrobacter koseri]|nr:hypothetical protein HMPREF3207_00145 [Citrobacter koseri]KXB43214.1 hypothetical protein HMPREF0208_02806 [Citrobacter koseri]
MKINFYIHQVNPSLPGLLILASRLLFPLRTQNGVCKRET